MQSQDGFIIATVVSGLAILAVISSLWLPSPALDDTLGEEALALEAQNAWVPRHWKKL